MALRRIEQAAAGLRGNGDPLDTAVALFRLTIEERTLPTTMWALSHQSGQVWLQSGLPEGTRRLALAHEVGHFAHWRGHLRIDQRGSEWWADWFAYELLLPAAEIAPFDSPMQATQATGEAPVVALAQWLRTRPADGLVAQTSAGQWACALCGHRNHDIACACYALRTGGDRIPTAA